MTTTDPRIDAYIEKAADYAQPILARLRALVHATCPDVVETVKWGHPSFEYKGILCGMAAFKEHCAFGFWKHELVIQEAVRQREAMGSFGCLKSVDDIPPKTKFAAWMKRAMQLNEDGVKVERKPARPKTPPRMHPGLKAALAKSARARATFEAFPPSQKREYLDWISEAKADATRARRITQAVQWLAQGKRRNWKYER